MKLSQSNFNLESQGCHLVRSYQIASLNDVFEYELFFFTKKNIFQQHNQFVLVSLFDIKQD